MDAAEGLTVGIPDSLGPRRFARTKATLIENCHAVWRLSFAKRSSAGVEASLRSSQRLMRHEVQQPLNALFEIGFRRNQTQHQISVALKIIKMPRMNQHRFLLH